MTTITITIGTPDGGLSWTVYDDEGDSVAFTTYSKDEAEEEVEARWDRYRCMSDTIVKVRRR